MDLADFKNFVSGISILHRLCKSMIFSIDFVGSSIIFSSQIDKMTIAS